MKLGNEIYTCSEINLMATYEEIYRVPVEQQVTQWCGDMHVYELRLGVKPDDVKQVFEKALSVIKMTRDEFEKFNHSYQNTIKYKMKENMPRKYEAVIIFNKPMLFTNERLEYDDIPDGLHRYDIRDGGMDGNMCELKDYVAVNHWGTVLSRDAVESKIIDGQEMNSQSGIVMTDDDYNYTGEEFTTEEYLENYMYLVEEYCEPKENMEMRM